MANVSAFIKPSKGKSDTKVRFYLSRGRSETRLFYTSNIEVNTECFDSKKQIIKERIIYNDKARADFNKSVNDFKAIILKAYNNAEEKESLTSKLLESEIEKILHPENNKLSDNESMTPESVLLFVKQFVESAGSRKDKKTGRLLSPNTRKQYVTTEKHLIAFAKAKRKKDFQFSDINEKFYFDFVDYLTNKEYTVKTKRGEAVNEKQSYTLNSVGKYVRALKVMLASAKHPEADTTAFYVFNEDVDNVYLNEAELQRLKDFDFSNVPHLDRVRDWFLLLAWTGSRFSDLEKIGKSNIKNGMLTYRQQKTNTQVTIPLHPVVDEILKKHDFEMPDVISNQKFNDYIKDVCRLAGIDEMESITRTIGGKLTTEIKPKYKLVSSHTCRRSFCTNMYLRGLDTMMIRSISGHKTEKSFLKYIKVSQQQHAEMMAEKWKEMYK